MKVQIQGAQAFSYLAVQLEPGETLLAKVSTLSTMDTGLELTTAFNGGIFRALLHKLLPGNHALLSRFTNHAPHNCHLTLAPTTPGELRKMVLNNDTMNLQPGALLACSEGLTLRPHWAGLFSWLLGKGLLTLQISGTGVLFYGAYGSLVDKEVDGEYIVDAQYVVAYPSSLTLTLQPSDRGFPNLFRRKRLLARAVGQGKLTLQSRSLSTLANWLNPRFR